MNKKSYLKRGLDVLKAWDRCRVIFSGPGRYDATLERHFFWMAAGLLAWHAMLPFPLSLKNKWVWCFQGRVGALGFGLVFLLNALGAYFPKKWGFLQDFSAPREPSLQKGIFFSIFMLMLIGFMWWISVWNRDYFR